MIVAPKRSAQDRDQYRQAPGDAALSAGLNASFTEAAQRDNTVGTRRTVVWMGKHMKFVAVLGRSGVYEAMALALFAGMVVLFVHAIVPLIAD
jgi:hypothetical protein